MGKKLEKFKEQVKATALATARDEGWCDEGVKEALGGLGIEVTDDDLHPEPEKTVVSFVYTLKFQVTAPIDGDKIDDTHAESGEWNAASVRGGAGSIIARELSLDSDWHGDEATITFIGHDATPAEAVAD